MNAPENIPAPQPVTPAEQCADEPEEGYKVDAAGTFLG